MRTLLVVATTLQVAAAAYGALLLRRHRNAPAGWLCLLGTLLSMLVWRVGMTTGATPGLVFNTSIAISGSVCAVLAMFFFGHEVVRRERAEAERDRLLTSERLARRQADQANRLKDEFMATLSHELRSPRAIVRSRLDGSGSRTSRGPRPVHDVGKGAHECTVISWRPQRSRGPDAFRA
jgi:signal transduction histidine kinase